MYVGVTTALVGEALLTGSRAMWIYAALVAVGFHLRVILYEEPAMRRLDATGWAAYAARVKRWGVV
jgi:protein-S-isoprenylcysteine O-methyltransferase Ste14